MALSFSLFWVFTSLILVGLCVPALCPYSSSLLKITTLLLAICWYIMVISRRWCSWRRLMCVCWASMCVSLVSMDTSIFDMTLASLRVWPLLAGCLRWRFSYPWSRFSCQVDYVTVVVLVGWEANCSWESGSGNWFSLALMFLITVVSMKASIHRVTMIVDSKSTS